jgi:hypothetical protein
MTSSAARFTERVWALTHRVIGAALFLVLAGMATAAEKEGSVAQPSCVRWKLVPSPIRIGGDIGWNVLNAVAARSPNDAWAVGWHESEDENSNDELTYAQHWDGAAWSIVSTPNPPPRGFPYFPRLNYFQDVAIVGKSEAWAVGYYRYYEEGREVFDEALSEHWDGNAWSLVPMPDLGRRSLLHAVAGASPKDVWAVGSWAGKALTLHWNGSAWSVVRVPVTGASQSLLYAIDARAANDVWAVGYRSGRRGTTPLVEHWNGRRWRVLRLPTKRLPNRNGLFRAVHALSSRNVWAVGIDQVEGNEHTLTGHWNGRSWSFGSTPNRRFESNELWAVAAARGGEVWAGGFWDSAQLLIQHRRGGRWRTSRLEGMRAGWLTDIELRSRRDGWAVGAYFFPGGYRPLTQRLTRC